MPITQSRGLVVAMAAWEHLLAARCHDFASPPVMLAPVLHLSHVTTVPLSVEGNVVDGEVRSSHPRRTAAAATVGKGEESVVGL